MKPENVLVSHDGYVKIADFGLSKEKIIKSSSADKLITFEIEAILSSFIENDEKTNNLQLRFQNKQ